MWGFLWINTWEWVCGVPWQFFLSSFDEPPYCFPLQLYQFLVSPTAHEGSLFFTSPPTLVACWLSDDGHPDRCEMTAHCDFHLHCADEACHWASFPMSLGHLYVLFGGKSIRFSSYVFIHGSLCILGISCLYLLPFIWFCFHFVTPKLFILISYMWILFSYPFSLLMSWLEYLIHLHLMKVIISRM